MTTKSFRFLSKGLITKQTNMNQIRSIKEIFFRITFVTTILMLAACNEVKFDHYAMEDEALFPDHCRLKRKSILFLNQMTVYDTNNNRLSKI